MTVEINVKGSKAKGHKDGEMRDKDGEEDGKGPQSNSPQREAECNSQVLK